MHISDEPHETENWLWFREQLKKYMPNIPCSEPLDQLDSAIALEGACNEFIPRLEVFEQGKDFSRRRKEAGDKIWCYSCCYPEEPWYLNKFADLPSRYSRMIYWACFAQDISGFLHWGLNYWNMPLFGIDPSARFKGDGHIIYPDAENKDFDFSNRGLATVQGAEEYELLRIASEKYPLEAKNLALRITRSFSDFDDDPELLENLRIRLL